MNFVYLEPILGVWAAEIHSEDIDVIFHLLKEIEGEREREIWNR